MKKYFTALLLIFSIPFLYADDIQPTEDLGVIAGLICADKTCPYINKNNGNLISIDCKDSPSHPFCDITYKNHLGKERTEFNSFFATSDTEISWLPNHLAEIFDYNGKFETKAVFIDFDNMYFSYIANPFAININQQIAAYDQNERDELQIGKIFNPKVKIFVLLKDMTMATIQIIRYDTKFDEEGNLKLVYYSNDANNTQMTKTIPIDYNWFKETANDKTVRCYEYKPDVSQKLTSITCPKL